MKPYRIGLGYMCRSVVALVSPKPWSGPNRWAGVAVLVALSGRIRGTRNGAGESSSDESVGVRWYGVHSIEDNASSTSGGRLFRSICTLSCPLSNVNRIYRTIFYLYIRVVLCLCFCESESEIYNADSLLAKFSRRGLPYGATIQTIINGCELWAYTMSATVRFVISKPCAPALAGQLCTKQSG